jgi:hypothetical protein
MPDPFDGYAQSLESPATILVPVTPEDAADLPMPSRALNVTQEGLVRVTTTGGSTATLYIAAGIGFPVRATRVWATGTTATGITALV